MASENKNWSGRVLNCIEEVAVEGMNTGFATGWVYDVTFAIIAANLVDNAVQHSEDDKKSEELVQGLENTNFFMFGNPNLKPRSQETEMKAEFASEVIAPLYEAFKGNEALYQRYNCADGMFKYILDQWLPES